MIGEWTQRLRSQAGYSLIELLTNMAIIAVLAGTAIPHLDTRVQDLQTVTKQVMSDYRWARVRAITGGAHFRLKWLSTGSYRIERLKLTGTTWDTDVIVKQVDLPATITHSSGVSNVEFDTRGMMVSSGSMVSQGLSDSKYGVTRTLGVWPSGQTNVYN